MILSEVKAIVAAFYNKKVVSSSIDVKVEELKCHTWWQAPVCGQQYYWSGAQHARVKVLASK